MARGINRAQLLHEAKLRNRGAQKASLQAQNVPYLQHNVKTKEKASAKKTTAKKTTAKKTTAKKTAAKKS